METAGPTRRRGRLVIKRQIEQRQVDNCYNFKFWNAPSTPLNPSDWAQGLRVSLYISGEWESVLLMMLHIQMDDGKMDLFHALS